MTLDKTNLDMQTSSSSSLPKKEFLFLPLGGCGEIGMNLSLYGYNGKWLMVDLGVTFTHELGLEVMMPDPRYIVERRQDLVGLVLTHGHEDHIGAIPHLWSQLRCPIYATPFTAFLVREKLKEAGLSKQAVVHEIPLSGTVDLKPFHVEFVTLTHSIPEPNAVAITTPAGTVVHTGDWKIDDAPLVGDISDVDRLQALGARGILALVCDSTNVFVKGRTGSEILVRQELIKVIKRQKQRVIVACFASNLARLESAAIAAQETGRRVALVGRSLYRMEEAARRCGYLKNIPGFLPEDQIQKIPPHQLLMICTGSQGEPRSALTRIANKQHQRVKLSSGDTVIFSSRMIPGNEIEIRQLQDALIEQGLRVIHDEDENIHVSGHPSRDDLQMMYKWLQPQIIVPVHGERAHLREHAQFGLECGIPQAIQPYNGAVITLNSENLRVVQDVHHGRLALDGHVLIPCTNIQLRDRHRMMENGTIFVTLTLTKTGKIALKPNITLLGVVAEGSEQEMIDILQQQLTDLFAKTPSHVMNDHKALSELVRITCRSTLHAQRGKKPVVVTHITVKE